MQSRQRRAVLGSDRKIYFQFLKRLVSISKVLLLLIFSFVKKDVLSGNISPIDHVKPLSVLEVDEITALIWSVCAP